MTTIIDYSEKAIAVTGDTIQFKDEFRKLHGKWNYNLKCGMGWILSKKYEADVRLIIGQQKIEPVIKPVEKLIKQKVKRTSPIGVKKEALLLLKNQPACFDEAVIHFFLKGGKVKTAQLINELGYKSYKDVKPFFGFYAANGCSIDLLYEQPEFTGVRYVNYTGRDFVDSVISVILSYPGKGAMADRLIKLNQHEQEIEEWNYQYDNKFACQL